MHAELILVPLPGYAKITRAFDEFYRTISLRRFADLCCKARKKITVKAPSCIVLRWETGAKIGCGPFYFETQPVRPIPISSEAHLAEVLASESLAIRSNSPIDAASILDSLRWHQKVGSIGQISPIPINRCYANMQTMDLLSPFSEAAALECCRLGFAGQKWRILASDLQDDETLDRMISVICKFKANVGREHMLMVDSQRTWTASLGHRFIQALPANVLAWIEDAPPELVKDASDQGVGPHKPSFAAGETWHGLARFERAISSGCYSVIQPDAYVCGGVSVMIAIAKRCAEGSVIFAPHGRTFVESMIASEVACVRDQTLYEFNPILEPLRQSPFGRKCSNLLKVN